jgi:hypothetical protein
VNRVDFYVNGVLVHSQATATNGFNEATTVGFAIGALGRSTAFEGFDGLLDDLRIYDRELGAGNILDLYQEAPPLSSYVTWAESFGLEVSGDGAPLEDPDHDGIANSTEFLLGSSPVSGASENLPSVTEGSGSITFIYRRQLEAVAAGYQDLVEFSPLLTTDSWQLAVDGEGGVMIEEFPVDTESEEVRVVIPATGPKIFARLKVISQ